jgi:phage repressor protein C with HTH and peptisase S24 domain
MEDPRKAQGRRLAAAREEAGYRSARDAALSNNWPESTYRAHEAGTRTIGQDDAERYARRFRAAGVRVTAQAILFADEEETGPDEQRHRTVVPIMGYIGAGAEVDPDHEQVPPDGLDQVELRVQLPDDMIAFQVRGDSMLPKYDDGDVIVVYREQQQATDSLIGRVAAVRTYDGHRFVKRIMPGSKPHTFNLESINARTIIGARIAWSSEIWIIVPAGQVKHIGRSRSTRASERGKRGKVRQ